MNKITAHPPQKSLKRVLGIFGFFAAAIGGAASQTSIVSLLKVAGIGGGTFFVAFIIALILSLCYICSYCELSIMMPKAGGISTYTAVSMGRFPAIVATLVGSVGPAVFAAPAEFLLFDYLLHMMYPGIMAHPSLIFWTIFTVLNIMGVNIFSSVQKVLTYVMLTALVVTGVYGLGFAGAGGLPASAIMYGAIHINGSILSLVMLALWPLIGCESVCTLVEETKRPERNLPGGLFIALLALFAGFFIYALAGVRVLPASQLAASDIPHWLLAQALFGKAGRVAILVLGITTTSIGMNASVAWQARLLFGMGHNHQLPAIFKKIHSRWRTPWVSLLTIYLLGAGALLIVGNMPDFITIMIISASSTYLLVYIIANIDVIILRFKYPNFVRPFKTPFYPLPQILAIIGMGYAVIYNSPSAQLAAKVYINTAVLVAVSVVYGFFRVRYYMKKPLFEAEPIEQAISE